MKLAKITLAENESGNKYGSCTEYIVMMIVVFTIFTGITTYFVYYNWSLIKNVSCIKFGTHLKMFFFFGVKSSIGNEGVS